MYEVEEKVSVEKKNLPTNTSKLTQKRRNDVVQRAYDWSAHGYTAYGNLWRSGPANGAINGGGGIGATTIRYVGKASDFTGGGAAGAGDDFTNVNGYRNGYGYADGTTGALGAATVGTALNNNVVTYNHGHILPAQIGGGGYGTGNVFEQNAGQNNSNPWKSDENAAAAFVQGEGDKYVYYQVDLN